MIQKAVSNKLAPFLSDLISPDQSTFGSAPFRTPAAWKVYNKQWNWNNWKVHLEIEFALFHQRWKYLSWEKYSIGNYNRFNFFWLRPIDRVFSPFDSYANFCRFILECVTPKCPTFFKKKTLEKYDSFGTFPQQALFLGYNKTKKENVEHFGFMD